MIKKTNIHPSLSPSPSRGGKNAKMLNTEAPIYKSLISLGFSDKEVRVYLAVLELGRSTVARIARKGEINRTTGYDILSDLAAKGLVSISGKEPKQEYAAESPDSIKKLLEAKLEQDKKKLEAASKDLIPQLKSIHNVSQRPQVRFYEGVEGLKQVYEDTLTSHEPIRAYANVDDMHKGVPNYFPEYYRRRTRSKIKIRAIVPANEAGRERASRDTEEIRESALVPPDKYYFSPEINIYDDKVMIASWREKLGIIIESKEIAEAMKTIYELSWAEAKRFGEKLKIEVPKGQSEIV